MHKFGSSSIGLDIGESFIRFVELKKTKEGILLNKFGIKEIPPDLKSDRERAAMQTVSQLLSEHNIKARNVNIKAGGQSVFVRFVKLLQIKEDKLMKTMQFEAQNQIPFPLTEVAWDWSLLDRRSDKTRKAVIVAIKNNLLQDMLSNLKSIKLSTGLIDVAPISLYNCLMFNEDCDEKKLSAILEVGAKSSNLIIFKKDNVWTRGFPVDAIVWRNFYPR